MASYWAADAAAGEGEETPIVSPVKMELAPHARLGRRVNAIFASVILLVFHTTLIVAGGLNWDVPCEYHLSRFLVIYGACGLLFVYLLLREWMFYARLGSWPTTTTFLLLCIFYAANVGSGVILTMYTIRSRQRKNVQKQFIPASLMLCTGVLCAPCYLLYAGLLAPICRPFSVAMFKLCECCGCVTILTDGTLEFRNCFGEVTCGWVIRHATQCLMAPGMTTPGRSIVGVFINTTALLWFWCYLLFELYWNWNLMCDSAAPGPNDDLSSTWTWIKVLSPSPVHWLILIFAVTGLVLTLANFISDMFTSPRPPPRSAFEVHKWKLRRQMKVCMHVGLFCLFVTWGALLCYFVYSQEECASSAPSLYRLALLLLLVFFVLVGLAFLLFTCVCIDCCVSGRMRLVLLLADDNVPAKPAGVHSFLVGAERDANSRFASEAPELNRTTTYFSKAKPSDLNNQLPRDQNV